MDLLGLALGAVVGLSLGMLGGGGSILTVPIFVYVLGIEPKSAIAMSLPVVGVTSLVGAVGHWRAGNVGMRAALLFGSVAMVGAYAGSQLARLLTGGAQLLLLALVMVAAAIAMFRGGAGTRAPAAPADSASFPADPRLLVVALGVGVLTGLVGIGGGFVVVPALVLLARQPMKLAVGTSLVVIAMNALSGFAGYVGQVEIAWAFTALFTAVAIAGVLVGAKLVRFVPQGVLKKGFAAFLLIVGTLMLYQNRVTILGQAAAPDIPGAAGAADSRLPVASKETD